AAEGNAAAAKGEIKRQVVFGPILAQVKIDFDAIFYSRSRNNIWSIQPYWDCSKSVPGGFVSVYVFGVAEDQRDKMVTALVYLKNKEHRSDDWVHYLRTQAVPGIVGSDVKLQLLKQEDSDTLIPTLPVDFIEEGREKKRKYAVGFQYIDKEAKLKNESLATVASKLVDAIFKTSTKACA
ncbi:MAG: hypothetical protein ABIB72_02905, partial [Candidatus Falkowbacteria bacterium]